MGLVIMRWIYVPFGIILNIYILSKAHISPLRFSESKRAAGLQSPHSQLSNGENIVESEYHGDLQLILWYDFMVRSIVPIVPQ